MRKYILLFLLILCSLITKSQNHYEYDGILIDGNIIETAVKWAAVYDVETEVRIFNNGDTAIFPSEERYMLVLAKDQNVYEFDILYPQNNYGMLTYDFERISTWASESFGLKNPTKYCNTDFLRPFDNNGNLLDTDLLFEQVRNNQLFILNEFEFANLIVRIETYSFLDEVYVRLRLIDVFNFKKYKIKLDNCKGGK
ncbi:MAG: hypothetical protein MJ211_08005 [Bacteroidales bacterium]|nr:hypothetical protein [Bacteroidales bacterium]